MQGRPVAVSAAELVNALVTLREQVPDTSALAARPMVNLRYFPRLSMMYPRRWCGRGLLLRPFLTRRDSRGTGQLARKGSLVGLAADRRGKESDLLDYTTTPTMRAPPRSSTTRFASDTRRPAGSCCGITTRPGRG